MPKDIFPGFPPEALRFLRQLKRNNNRDWFLQNKTVYETKVKAPMIDLLSKLQPEIRKFAPEISYDPVKSIFRIYRDIRFSSDKSPYKTNIAASLSPSDRRGQHFAGLYLHLDPDEFMVAGGLYHPEKDALMAVRQHVASEYTKLRSIIQSQLFKKFFGKMEGDQLSRVPRGFSANHPAGDLLRHKDFLAYSGFEAKFAESPDLQKAILERFHAMMPLLRFLNNALQKMPRSQQNFLP